MTKFSLAKNGTTITNAPTFYTRSEAEEHVIAIGGGYEIVETPEATPVTLERALTENEILKAENAILKSETERLSKAFTDVRDFIQASINRGEWDGELEEIFWEELALKLGLDLKLTEEVDVTVTLTYSGTVTVPKGTDLAEIEFDTSWYLTGNYDGEDVAELTYDEIEITRD